MNILVCITHVPDTTSKISFSDGNTKFNADGVQYIIGPYDDYALSKAVDIKAQVGAGEITVLNVGTAETEPTLRKALAIGADKGIRIDVDPKDSYFTAQQIAAVVKEGNYDLVLMGRESIDFNSGVVHTMVGELTGIPVVTPVMHLDLEGTTLKIEKEIDGGKQKLTASLPLIVGCQEPIAEWKIPNMRGIMTARTKPLDIKPAYASEILTSVKTFELPAPKASVKLIDPSNVQELVNLLKNEAKVL